MSQTGIHQVTYIGYWIRVHWTYLVKVCKVCAHPDLIVFLCTATMFETHLVYLASLIKLTVKNLSTSAYTWERLSGFILLGIYLTGFVLGLVSNLWQATSRSTLGICSYRQANTWLYFLKSECNSSYYWWLISIEMNVVLSSALPIMTALVCP